MARPDAPGPARCAPHVANLAGTRARRAAQQAFEGELGVGLQRSWAPRLGRTAGWPAPGRQTMRPAFRSSRSRDQHRPAFRVGTGYVAHCAYAQSIAESRGNTPYHQGMTRILCRSTRERPMPSDRRAGAAAAAQRRRAGQAPLAREPGWAPGGDRAGLRRDLRAGLGRRALRQVGGRRAHRAAARPAGRRGTRAVPTLQVEALFPTARAGHVDAPSAPPRGRARRGAPGEARSNWPPAGSGHRGAAQHRRAADLGVLTRPAEG